LDHHYFINLESIFQDMADQSYSGIIILRWLNLSNEQAREKPRGIFTMTSEIISQLGEWITTEIIRQPDRKIAAEEALISGGLIDSFSLVDLALHVEENFGVRIDDTELNSDTFDNLSQLADLIKSRQT
jgi:acyl carrier protein